MFKERIPSAVRKPLRKMHYESLQLLARALGRLSPYENFVVIPKDAFVADGLVSIHDSTFSNAPSFQHAYARAVKAAGADWDIPWRTHVALWSADACKSVPGDFVELGTGRGWMFSAILSSLDWVGMTKQLFLFDTFTDMRLDGISGRAINRNEKHPCYALSFEETISNFADWDRVELVRGRIPESLKEVELLNISFLHIDLNNADSEVSALKDLWPKISVGALVLLDDYAYRGYRPQYEAMNTLGVELGFKVLSLPTGQGLIYKATA